MKRAGFTLIELLIVMAIIAALMAVLIPTATGAMRKARATRIAVQLRNLEQGLRQYILATLPSKDEVDDKDIDHWKSKLENSGFVDENFLNDDGLTITTTASDTQILITIEYNVGNSALAELVVGSLKETYNATLTNDNKGVEIKSSLEAFWW